MNSDSESFKMSPMLGEEDYFSSLPDDFLFHVLGLLDRDSLDVMEAVSQKMNCITRHESFPKCKKGKYSIIIEQNEHGHTLCVNQFEDDEYSLIYTTNGNEKGVKRRILGPYKDYYASMSRRIVQPTQVPDKFFKVLQELCSKQKHNILHIFKVRLDESFLRRLLLAFRGKLPFALRLNEVTVDEQMNLAEFLLKENICDLQVINPNTRMQAVFDEEFLKEFSLIDGQFFNLKVDYTSVTTRRISRDFLPIICRFEDLTLETYILPGELLTDLIMMGFKTLNEGDIFSWTFAFNDVVNESDLGCFNNDEFHMEIIADSATSSFKITQKLTKTSCKFKYMDYESPIHVSLIEFFFSHL